MNDTCICLPTSIFLCIYYHVNSCLCLPVTSISVPYFFTFISLLICLSVCKQFHVHLSTCIYFPMYLFICVILCISICKCLCLSFFPPNLTLLRPIFFSITLIYSIPYLYHQTFINMENTYFHLSVFLLFYFFLSVYLFILSHLTFPVSFSLFCPLNL